MKYLSEAVKRGFEKYKYNSKDTSPIAIYIMHPFWDWIVQFLPRWLAPNLMTLIGFLMCVFNFLIMAYYDPDFTASNSDLPGPPIPASVWLGAAILNFFAHTLDGTDGKQARRTGSSSPIGEMFDHGCDSWACLFFPVCLYSVFGRGVFGAPTTVMLVMLWVVMGCFILSHWEKYNTGVLYLPWGYDLSQLSMTFIYLATYLLGTDFWQANLPYTSFSYANLIVLSVQAMFWGMSFPATLWNVYLGYAHKTGRMLSLWESLRPLISTALLLVTSFLWAWRSPGMVIESHPRLFYTAVGTAMSSIACRLIVAQMSQTQAELFNPLGNMYAILVLCIVLCPSTAAPYEVGLLYCMVFLFVGFHLLYAFLVVNEMLDHFGLRAFVITPKPLQPAAAGIPTAANQDRDSQSEKRKAQ